MDQVKYAALSDEVKAKLLSEDSAMIKSGGLATSEYFRTEIRENAIRRRITPPTPVGKEDWGDAEDTDFPIIYVEIAPRSCGAVMVPFETGPTGEVIHGKKARIEFNRVMTKKYSIEKIRLETYKMPILDIFYDLMLKDIMDVEDRVTMNTDKKICGTINTVRPDMGMCRYVECGPLSRNSLVHLRKGMCYSPGNLIPTKYLMNNITYCDFGILDRDQVGGDLAQDMLIDGVTLTKVSGIDTIVTIKRDLVPENEVFIYTDPKFYGGFYTYKDVSMVTEEKDDIWLTFFAHEIIGASVINAAGVLRASMTGTAHDWITGE